MALLHDVANQTLATLSSAIVAEQNLGVMMGRLILPGGNVTCSDIAAAAPPRVARTIQVHAQVSWIIGT